MKCKNCGFEFDEGIFCPECGTKFDNNANIQHEEEQKNIEDNPNEKEYSSIMDVPFDKIFGDIFGDLFEKNADSTTSKQKTEENVNISDEKAELGKSKKNQTDPKEAQEVIKGKNGTKSQSVMGILSFIIGILSFCCIGFMLVPEIVGLILGIKGKKDPEHKTGLAKAGFVVNIVSLGLWVLIFALLLTPDSSKTNAVEEQAVESTIEQDANYRIEDEQETKEDNEVYTDDKERESEIDKKNVDLTDSENVTEEVSDTTDTTYEYSNEDICNMCSDYYLSLYGSEPPYAIVDHEDGDNVTVQLCEEVDEDGYGYNSWAFYTIDRITLSGYDVITGESIELTSFTKGYGKVNEGSEYNNNDETLPAQLEEKTQEIQEDIYKASKNDNQSESGMAYITIDIEYIKTKGIKYNDPAELYIDDEKICRLVPGESFQCDMIVDCGKHDIYMKRDALIRKSKTNKIKINVQAEGEYYKLQAEEGSIKGLTLSLQ